MKVRVQVVIEPDDDGPAVVQEVAELERNSFQIDTLGLQRAEAKALQRQVQEVVIEEQVRHCLAQRLACPDCGRVRPHKDARMILVRTLFGILRLRNPRWRHCPCQPRTTATFSPLAEALLNGSLRNCRIWRPSSPAWSPTA